MIAAIEEEESLELSADEEACLGEWVAGLDVIPTLVAISLEDSETGAEMFTAAGAEMFTAVGRCAPTLFLSSMLEGAGMTLRELSEEEASCLREWAADTDWSALTAGYTTDGPTVLIDPISDLLECTPVLLLSSMLGGAGMTLGELSEEEASCLREWAADTDWSALIAGYITGDAAVLTDFAPLIECLPDELPSPQPLVVSVAESFEDATPVSLGEDTQGEIEHGNDTDFFVFETEQGTLYQIDIALGTLTDSTVVLYDANGVLVAYNDDYENTPASRIVWNAPTSGSYYLEASSYDTGTGTYTLTIIIADFTDDHTNSIQGATAVTLGEDTQGEIEHGNDTDFFVFETEQGTLYQIDIALGTLTDSTVVLYDANGVLVAYNDDYENTPASRIVWNAPTSGSYYLEASSYDIFTGTYTLTIIAL